MEVKKYIELKQEEELIYLGNIICSEIDKLENLVDKRINNIFNKKFKLIVDLKNKWHEKMISL